jgi:hypothetical protein
MIVASVPGGSGCENKTDKLHLKYKNKNKSKIYIKVNYRRAYVFLWGLGDIGLLFLVQWRSSPRWNHLH